MKYIVRVLFLQDGEVVEWFKDTIILGQGVALKGIGTATTIRGYEVVYLEPLIEDIDAIK